MRMSEHDEKREGHFGDFMESFGGAGMSLLDDCEMKVTPNAKPRCDHCKKDILQCKQCGEHYSFQECQKEWPIHKTTCQLIAAHRVQHWSWSVRPDLPGFFFLLESDFLYFGLIRSNRFGSNLFRSAKIWRCRTEISLLFLRRVVYYKISCSCSRECQKEWSNDKTACRLNADVVDCAETWHPLIACWSRIWSIYVTRFYVANGPGSSSLRSNKFPRCSTEIYCDVSSGCHVWRRSGCTRENDFVRCLAGCTNQLPRGAVLLILVMRQDLSPLHERYIRCRSWRASNHHQMFFEYASVFDGDGFCKNFFFLFQWFRLSPLETLLGARIATSFSLYNHFKLRIQCCSLSQFCLWHISYMLREGNHVLEFWNCYILELHQVNLFVSCLNGASFATRYS